MAGYVNSPATDPPALTNYVNSPATAPTALTNYVNSPAGGGTPLPPGSPLLWYDGNNTDNLGNTTRVDGVLFSPWKNLGSYTADLSSVDGPRSPFWDAIGGVGKINNMPAVRSDGNRYTSNSPFSGGDIAQPLTLGFVFMTTDQSRTQSIFQGGTTGANTIQIVCIGPDLYIYAGTYVDTTLNVQSNKWHLFTVEFNGASSIARLDGVQTGPYNPGTAALGGAALLADSGGTNKWLGSVAECLVYPQASQSASGLESYLQDKYGSGFPQ